MKQPPPHHESPHQDSALLDRYISGDSRAGAALFFRYRRALTDFLRRRLAREDLVEECLQETFCRLLENAGRLLRHPRMEAWLFAVARNVAVDVCRKRARARPFTDLEEEERSLRPTGHVTAAPEARLQSRELNAVVVEAISRMPALEREVFLLRTQASLSFRTIAEKLGAPLNTVLSRMHRAMQKVRKALASAGWLDSGHQALKGRRRT